MADEIIDVEDELDPDEELVLATVPGTGKASASYEAAYLRAMDRAGLPSHVDLRIEYEWIAAHPAISRLDRSHKKTAKVLITEKDVLHPPHGPAPSRRAVHSLQHWANSPKEFQKLMLGEYRELRKKAREDATGAAPGEVYDEMTDVLRILSHYNVSKKRAEGSADESP